MDRVECEISVPFQFGNKLTLSTVITAENRVSFQMIKLDFDLSLIVAELSSPMRWETGRPVENAATAFRS